MMMGWLLTVQKILGENLPVMRPGFGLPLSYMTDRDIGDEGVWKAATLLNREACMLKFLNELSDKPEWWKKVKNDEIAAKWKKEALETNWASYLKHADFTPAMADAVSFQFADILNVSTNKDLQVYQRAEEKGVHIRTDRLYNRL